MITLERETGPIAGPAAMRRPDPKGTPMIPRSFALPILCTAAVLPVRADIVWTGAVSDDAFDEANWDLSGSSVTQVDPGVAIADNVVIVDAPAPIDVAVPGGQSNLKLADGFLLTIENSTVFTSDNDGLSGEVGTSNGPVVRVVGGGDVATFFITNGCHMTIDEASTAHLAGPNNPINGATIELTLGARLACTAETVADFITEHLHKISVDGAPAIVDGNVTVVSDGGAGCIVEAIPQPVGTPFCFGDGTGAACPCGNVGGSGRGCGNGAFPEGARLEATGDLDAVSLALSGGTPGQPMLFFQGHNAINGGSGVPFGDGLRCAGGSVVRLGVEGIDGTGEATLTGTVQDNGGGGAPGESRTYQGWYRDPAGSPCGFTFNLSNGVAVDF